MKAEDDALAAVVVERPDEIFGVQTVSKVGDEVDVRLARAGEIENGKAFLSALIREELLESPARPRGHDLLIEDGGSRRMIRGRNNGGTRGQRISWTTEHAPQSFRN